MHRQERLKRGREVSPALCSSCGWGQQWQEGSGEWDSAPKGDLCTIEHSSQYYRPVAAFIAAPVIACGYGLWVTALACCGSGCGLLLWLLHWSTSWLAGSSLFFLSMEHKGSFIAWTCWQIHSIRSDAVCCPLKLGQIGATLCSWGASDKLSDGFLAVYPPPLKVPDLLAEVCDSICDGALLSASCRVICDNWKNLADNAEWLKSILQSALQREQSKHCCLKSCTNMNSNFANLNLKYCRTGCCIGRRYPSCRDVPKPPQM